MDTVLLALVASLLCAVGGHSTTAAANSARAPEPRSGIDVLRAMHDAYAGKWFRTLTFVQQTTVTRPDGTPSVSTWYESLSSPSRLRIDIGDPAQGRGVLYTADSLYVIANGAVTRRVNRGNPLLPFVAGIYAQPVDTTIRQLQPYHFDLSRLRTGIWEGRPVYIVGAMDSTDLTSPQFWVDRERLVAVRVLASFGAPGSAVDDVHFDDYVPLAESWLATKCIILQNGTPVQTEEYSDWKADRALPAGFFVAERWGEGPHWASAGGHEAESPDLVLVGGWLFTSTGHARIRNPGILMRAGKFLRVGGAFPVVRPGADTIRVSDNETIIPGLFDLHAHYAMDLFNKGRVDEIRAYPSLFLANGVTSTFPAGEMNADSMRALRIRINRGLEPGPRLLNSGPYFGTARPGWKRDISVDSIYAEVDHWAELGVAGFKAKGIAPYQLRALIDRAHQHGLTVTGHLDSGFRGSVNPRDALLMGIDRIEHFMGGDAYPDSVSAYASLEKMTRFDTPAYKRIMQLYISQHVYYDPTLSAYGYFGKRDPAVFTYFTDEKRFLTPYMRSVVDARPPRPVMQQFENIYWVKRKEIKAFYDAGGADLITLGTDHPSWGEFLTPFSVHRELLSFVLSGIPAEAALRFATINAANAMGLGDRLGSIEAGKWADAVIVRGNPVADIKAVRNARLVIKAGQLYDPAALMKSVEGTIGPASPADTVHWLGGTGHDFP